MRRELWWDEMESKTLERNYGLFAGPWTIDVKQFEK